MPEDVERDQQQQQPPATAPSTKRQQQQQQARQETLQRKVTKGQEVLTFMGYDRAVLAQLPEFVQQQVPFITTAKGAIDLQLLEYIKSLAVSNVSFANIANRLQELTHTQFHRRQLLYLSYAKEAEAAATALRGKHPQVCNVCLQQPAQ